MYILVILLVKEVHGKCFLLVKFIGQIDDLKVFVNIGTSEVSSIILTITSVELNAQNISADHSCTYISLVIFRIYSWVVDTARSGGFPIKVGYGSTPPGSANEKFLIENLQVEILSDPDSV